MYNLNSLWYTKIPKDKQDFLKLILILNSLKYNVKNIDIKDDAPVWIAASETNRHSRFKKIFAYTKNVKEQDFKELNFNYIPLEHLLSL